MRISIDEFRKRYPHLAKELSEENMDIVLQVDRWPVDPWRGYVPSVEDYLRRCNTADEAYEVIDYLEKHGRLNSEEASRYRSILKEKGLSAFGPHKEDDYYYRKAREYWRKMNTINSGD
jgi:hypothetical protein